ncbi:hypothetical protein PsorP6_000150 [Peronosclerospora sorghi]|uniref:Uncharacterized protein n=1 Tax=Peronosclerospora sorghi TaxID=230839 RepID=A0ACC0WRB6_9STRA|nr:hypothetical protein PsorP6_000150 [Peronosclerospora sorghi]
MRGHTREAPDCPRRYNVAPPYSPNAFPHNTSSSNCGHIPYSSSLLLLDNATDSSPNQTRARIAPPPSDHSAAGS